MTKTQRIDCVYFLSFCLALVAVCFVAGVFAGIDKALTAQERRNHLSVYCQQEGAMETLCAGLQKEEEQ